MPNNENNVPENMKGYMEAQDKLFEACPEMNNPFWWDHGNGEKVKIPDYLNNHIDEKFEKAGNKIASIDSEENK